MTSDTLLRTANTAIDSLALAKREKQLREQAGKLVAQTFFGTLLKSVRQSPWKSEMFSGGKGGNAYQGLMDQQMVEKLGKGVGEKLVDSMVRQWMPAPTRKGASAAADDAKSAKPAGPAAQELPTGAAPPVQPTARPRELQHEIQKNLRPDTHRYGATAITA